MTDEKSPVAKPGLLTLAWFQPIYRRAILIGVLVVWSAWEWFGNKDQFWGLVTLAAIAYGVWSLFINFDRDLAKQQQQTDGKPKS